MQMALKVGDLSHTSPNGHPNKFSPRRERWLKATWKCKKQVTKRHPHICLLLIRFKRSLEIAWKV